MEGNNISALLESVSPWTKCRFSHIPTLKPLQGVIPKRWFSASLGIPFLTKPIWTIGHLSTDHSAEFCISETGSTEMGMVSFKAHHKFNVQFPSLTHSTILNFSLTSPSKFYHYFYWMMFALGLSTWDFLSLSPLLSATSWQQVLLKIWQNLLQKKMLTGQQTGLS